MKRKRKQKRKRGRNVPEKVLVLASVASMIDQFNLPNIKLLQEMGYEVHVACNFKNGNTCDTAQVLSLSKRLRRMHVALHQWDCPRSVCSVKKCWIAYRQIRRLLRRTPFAWMHCQSPVGGALARIAAHQAGLPVIYTAHGFHFYKGAPFWNWLLYYPVEKLLSYWTDMLITVNKEDCHFAQRNLRAQKIVYIPGVGVDPVYFAAKKALLKDGAKREFRRKYRIPEQAFVLLSVGELSRRKNHRMVLSALAELARPDVYYVVCGQGAYGDALRSYAEKKGISGRLRLVGYQEYLNQWYRNADIFVFPSKQEGMPVALMEAMAAGLPCVVSDIRGSRELIAERPDGGRGLSAWRAVKDAGGIRVPVNDPKCFAQALQVLLQSGSLRYACGERNREKIKHYALPVVEERMRRIYTDFSRSRNRTQARWNASKTGKKPQEWERRIKNDQGIACTQIKQICRSGKCGNYDM